MLSLGLAFTSCDRSYDDPEGYTIFTDEDIEARGLEIVSVKDLKQYYWDNANLAHISDVDGVKIYQNWAVKVRMMSTDMYGNIYRTIYVMDEKEGVSAEEAHGIEVKVGLSSFYNYFSPGKTLYIKVQDLVLGNYRGNVSIGAESTNAQYSNGFIDVLIAFTNNKHQRSQFFQGALTGPRDGDTIVINSPADLKDDYVGRLVRINNLTYTEGEWLQEGSSRPNPYPSFLQSIPSELGGKPTYYNFNFREVIVAWNQYHADYQAWVDAGKPSGEEPKTPMATVDGAYVDVPEPGNLNGPTWAFKNSDNQDNFYGSCLFKLGPGNAMNENIVVRTSGYARFANDLLPENGTEANVTGILGLYHSSSGGFPSYQLTLNKKYDVCDRSGKPL